MVGTLINYNMNSVLHAIRRDNVNNKKFRIDDCKVIIFKNSDYLLVSSCRLKYNNYGDDWWYSIDDPICFDSVIKNIGNNGVIYE